MAEMLSQDEIDALLGGSDTREAESDIIGNDVDMDELVTSEVKDILGEMGNISMGTAATTLSALLNQRVYITTPVVSVKTWDSIAESYTRPCVGVRIDYKIGLKGANLLILVNRDVKIITSLMLGGDGTVAEGDDKLTELDLSAIGEAMNQMIGSSSTSLASMMNEKIDIATPKPFLMDFNDESIFDEIMNKEPDNRMVAISFDMQVGDLIDSKIVQALPIKFALMMAKKLKKEFVGSEEETPVQAPARAEETEEPVPIAEVPQEQPVYREPVPTPVPQSEVYYREAAPMTPQMTMQQTSQRVTPDVSAQAVQFQSFDFASVSQQKENIDILMDVPLEVTVELGKTSKRIKEILEFSPGTIIELDKLAGEPIDILVNGKYVAKGEVVVIEENFAIRVTSIISAELRV